MRTKRTNGTNTYEYVYNGDQLTRMVLNGENVDFTYAGGIPITMTYQGATYFYVTNAQGDVIGITDSEGNAIIGYYYEAYGKTYYITYDSTLAPVLAQANPLCYRGYILDTGTGLYYCQSRYYDPVMGRFINADNYPTTGQGFTGNNMFAYCGNNPVVRADASGEFFNTICGAIVGAVVSVVTRSDKESVGQALLRGAVTGAVAGAGLDICIATGGAAAGLFVAGALGAGSAMVDTAWEAHNNGTTTSTGDIVLSGTIGGGLNVLFGAAGREVGNYVGKTVYAVGEAVWKNTIKSVTNRAGKVVTKKLLIETAKNLAYSSVQGSFGKIFTLVGSKMLEVFQE